MSDGVDALQADLFAWRPDRRSDVVFLGFWLSHVPLERFDAVHRTAGVFHWGAGARL